MNAHGQQQPGKHGTPSRIGEYEVQRVLGAGGMATVYAALQKQPRRTVAVKVMRYPADAATAMHRFKREIEILGRLRHPYIAQVYDAGVHTDDGGSLPYFVMEYVPRAKTITEYATARQLSLRDRLKIFIKVCAAVEHGHLNKIIHRDLKPGNILIDETGDPKIIDFGVARVSEFDVANTTMHTEEGRLIGTIQYMAPEQLESTRQDLSPSCDVYALGVLLYKLLTGQPPYDLKGLPVFTAAQVIREDDPPRPSTIRPELRGDLETIILKALAKDRGRRYRSAGSLGRDLVRYLAAKPIMARDAGTAYRLRLFARRHRGQLVAGAIIMLVITGATAIIIQQRLTLMANAGPGTTPAPIVTPAVEPGAEAPTADDTPEAPPPIVLAGHPDAVSAVAFSPAGDMLASVSANTGLIVWDVDGERQRFTQNDHRAAVTQLAFASSGRYLATADDAGRVVIVDTVEGRVATTMRHRCAATRAFAVGPDGALIVLACDDLTVRMIGGDGDERVMSGNSGAFTAVALSGDGRHVAAGTERGVVSVWDVASRRRVRRFESISHRVLALAFDDDGATIHAASANGTVWTWDVQSEGPGQGTSAGPAGVVLASFDPASSAVAMASGDQIAVWSLEDGAFAVPPTDLPSDASFRTIALAPDGRVAAGDEAGSIRLLDFNPGEG